MISKYPVIVMILGIISNKKHIMSPYFFSKGLRIYTLDYLVILEEVVKIWLDQTAREDIIIYSTRIMLLLI